MCAHFKRIFSFYSSLNAYKFSVFDPSDISVQVCFSEVHAFQIYRFLHL